MVITSLKLRLFARAELEVERPGSCGYLAKSSERQKSSISQKIVTISMQNSKGEGFGNQTVDLIYHIPNEFCFLFRRTHVKHSCTLLVIFGPKSFHQSTLLMLGRPQKHVTDLVRQCIAQHSMECSKCTATHSLHAVHIEGNLHTPLRTRQCIPERLRRKTVRCM